VIVSGNDIREGLEVSMFDQPIAALMMIIVVLVSIGSYDKL
jgi:hypothetical protein